MANADDPPNRDSPRDEFRDSGDSGESVEGPGPSLLAEISTRWGQLNDPLQFVMRYATAIQGYLHAVVRNHADAEDVGQEFLTYVLARGFRNVSPDRGRFRHYLKAAVRNFSLLHLRRQRELQERRARHAWETVGEPATGGAQAIRDDAESLQDQVWLERWRACLLDRAWDGLQQSPSRGGDNLPYLVLRTAVDFQGEDSQRLADRVATLLGRPLRADAFRKQLSRSRAAFARLLIAEVRQTMQGDDRTALEEELIDVGLYEMVKPFLDDSSDA